MFEIDAQKILQRDEFGKRFTSFCREQKLSLGELSNLCKNAPHTSKSSFQRLSHGLMLEKYYISLLPTLEGIFKNWMTAKNLSDDEIETNLNQLFPHRMEINMIINRRELTANAIKFFGLKADPFDVDRVPGDDEFFTNKDLDEIAARVKDAVLYRRFIAVVGSVGTGKTSMKIRIARELSELRQKIHLLSPEFFDMNAVNVGAIASSILEEFEVRPPRDVTARVRKIREILSSLHKEDARVALIFDECHRLNDTVLTSLKNFWEMTNGGYSRLMGVVLFGQPKFVDATLRDTKFREIAERVNILEMPPLEKSAREYLAHKISLVGGDIDVLFEKKAVERICRVAKTPLSLGNLANDALMEAFKLEENQVASSMLSIPENSQIKAIRRVA